jgi:hypothetical protein
MQKTTSIDAYTGDLWRAVGRLWPNLGKDPAAVVQPYIPVLPAYVAEAHAKGQTPESAAVEVMRFFLRIYIENALTAEERNAQLVDLHALSKRSFEESQAVPVLPFTAALVGAQQTVSGWAAEGKVANDAGQGLDREVISALLGRSPGEVSRLGWLTLEAAGKS